MVKNKGFVNPLKKWKSYLHDVFLSYDVTSCESLAHVAVKSHVMYTGCMISGGSVQGMDDTYD